MVFRFELLQPNGVTSVEDVLSGDAINTISTNEVIGATERL